MTRAPITEKVTGLRQRRRADGSWRVWWEPSAKARAAGVLTVDLDADRPTWSVRQARRLNDDAGRATTPGKRRASGTRSMTALIDAYSRDQLTEKAAATQDSYRGLMKLIDEKWGDELVTDMTKSVLYQWGKALQTARGTTQAKRLTAMCSILFSYAELLGWRPENTNPCFRLKLATPPKRTRVATLDEFEALETAARADGAMAMHHALLFGLFTGQRLTDILNARLGDFRQVTRPASATAPQRTVWAWKILRSKRRTAGLLELHPELERALTERRAQTDDPDAPLLSDRGNAFTMDRFQKAFAALRSAAAAQAPSLTGPDPLWFKDLRRTAGVWARHGGAERQDIGDLLGNTVATDDQLADVYMPASFETAARAINAIRRPAKDRKRKKA
ncbi:hypothetical protein [Oceaniglobus trochenteri]|uniref:hypothetical protein n=1 Tax=Oceaniglobus trochenteri TaxID=2763260 RepID=UPI001D000ACB|nr:hypothetical protein [Oceaniglobus trochenteri]